MNKLFLYLRKNIGHIFLSFTLVSSAFALNQFGLILYSFGILITALIIIAYHDKFELNIFFAFLSICIVSSLLNNTFNYRLVLFSLIIIFFTPIIRSKRVFIFRFKYIKSSLLIFPIISIFNLLAYVMGINMANTSEGINWDFSGLFWHPLWLGAANGISNIVLIWHYLNSKSKLGKLSYIIWFLLSIFISVVSGSRSALLASFISIIYIVYIYSFNYKLFLKYILLFILIVLSTFPFYYKSAVRIIAKQQYQAEVGETSRTYFMGQRLNEISKSPIYGIGFSASLNKNGEKITGRMESGSGWLSVFSQTGLIGLILIIIILFRAYNRVKLFVKYDSDLALLVSVILYLCIHSIFEGYILTSGYYLSILFWGIIGIIYNYPIERIISKVQINKS